MSTHNRYSWQTLSPYLDEALELGEPARANWLSCIRRENAPLAAALEALLEEHRVLARERFLEQGRIPQSWQALSGETLGAYKLICEIPSVAVETGCLKLTA
ncbi:MAG TPA: hypothetical protein VM120_22665 [Bryobacteraceae bacterium]|nr:hypothetical protein [Bryobacteraceae bacterium]